MTWHRSRCAASPPGNPSWSDAMHVLQFHLEMNTTAEGGRPCQSPGWFTLPGCISRTGCL